jgi:hypothetical protein
VGISAWRYHRSRTALGDGVVTSARVVCTVRDHAANPLIAQDLVEQIGQHRRISGVAVGDLNRSDFQRLLVDTDVDLAPDASLGAAVLAGIPLAFPFDLDAGAIHCSAVVCLQTKRSDKQVQRALRAAIRNVHRKCLLALADGAGLRQVPIECRKPQEAFHKACHLT